MADQLVLRADPDVDSPLWTSAGANATPDDVPLTDALWDRLEIWADRWTQERPTDALRDEARRLVAEVQRQLGPAWEVSWDEGPVELRIDLGRDRPKRRP